jgi:hypothetical protein
VATAAVDKEIAMALIIKLLEQQILAVAAVDNQLQVTEQVQTADQV